LADIANIIDDNFSFFCKYFTNPCGVSPVRVLNEINILPMNCVRCMIQEFFFYSWQEPSKQRTSTAEDNIPVEFFLEFHITTM